MVTPRSSTISASCSAPPGSAKSAVTTRVATPLMRDKSEASVSSFSRERPVSTRLQPRCASCRANSSPSPDEAPVTRANVPEKTSLSISSLGGALPAETQIVISQHDGNHRFADRYEARQETWIVTTLGANRRFFAATRDRRLFSRQATRWLDRRAYHDRHAGGDPAEHPTVTIAARTNAALACPGLLREKFVVVLAAALHGASEAGSVLDPEDRG